MPDIIRGSVGIKTLRELSGMKTGKNGNKTQVIVLQLLDKFSKPSNSYKYHTYLNNFFISIKFIVYTKDLKYRIINTYRI